MTTFLEYRHMGKALRKQVDRKDQKKWKEDSSRPSVVELIQQSNQDRLPDLIPIRLGRMLSSPFAFYRGTAAIMAFDLSQLPQTDLTVQAVGDCHLMNFGGFATPERTLVFDVNDFDETLPASWEWDIKRLATSFALAGRHKNLKEYKVRELAYLVCHAYREHIIRFSKLEFLDLWYMKFDVELIRNSTRNASVKGVMDQAIVKAKKSTNETELYKMTKNVAGKFEILDKPPLIYHPFDLGKDPEVMHVFMGQYAKTLQPDRQWLLEKYKLADIALKVVGVGSVGTRCYVALLMNEKEEPLFLQLKEARPSVLEAFTAPSLYPHCGQRVVEGQRLVQAASDIFLGWSTSPSGRQYYVRQLRDRKISPDVEQFDASVLEAYAGLCGRMLARAHAKTGNAAAMAAYMGKNDILEDAISRFAVAYADQTEKDYAGFSKAVKAGILPVAKESSTGSAKVNTTIQYSI